MSDIAVKHERSMAPYLEAIVTAKDGFLKQSFAPAMNFDEEKDHAIELLFKNSKAMQAAQENPHFVRRSVTKVASIGLTLNPAMAYAYLVPRYDKNVGNHICLDISWKGLVKLATDSGAIKWAKSEIVRENDTFKFNGVASQPVHEMEPFGDRGEMVGVYCVAKTVDGDFLTDTMSMSEINEIQETSKAKYGPWKTFFGEMAKKSVIKRAQKQWPKGNDNRLEKAIEHLNNNEGLEATGDEVNPNDFQLDGELIEPFFEAFFKNDSWLMFEVQDRCTDEQWPLLLDSFKRSDKKVTEKKNKVKNLVWDAQAVMIDIFDAFKMNIKEGHEDGMVNDLLNDIPSEYFKNKLIERSNEV